MIYFPKLISTENNMDPNHPTIINNIYHRSETTKVSFKKKKVRTQEVNLITLNFAPHVTRSLHMVNIQCVIILVELIFVHRPTFELFSTRKLSRSTVSSFVTITFRL